MHVRQWYANGLRFIPRYLAESRRAAAGGGDRYRDNRFEVEARAAADAVTSVGQDPGRRPGAGT